MKTSGHVFIRVQANPIARIMSLTWSHALKNVVSGNIVLGLLFGTIMDTQKEWYEMLPVVKSNLLRPHGSICWWHYCTTWGGILLVIFLLPFWRWTPVKTWMVIWPLAATVANGRGAQVQLASRCACRWQIVSSHPLRPDRQDWPTVYKTTYGKIMGYVDTATLILEHLVVAELPATLPQEVVW